MAAIGDVLRLVVKATALGQAIENRYHYRIVTLGTAASTSEANEDLANRWAEVFLAATLINMLSDQTDFSELLVYNLNDLVGDYTETSSAQGTVTGEALPSFVSASFQLRLGTKAIRFGRKAIGVLSEGSINGNTPTAGFVTLANALETALALPLVGSIYGATFVPVVASIPSPESRPYIPQSAQILEAIFRGVGTQYSRKEGRGS